MYIIGPDFQTMPFLDSRLRGNDVVVPKDAVAGMTVVGLRE